MTGSFPMSTACTGMIKALSELLPLAMKHDRNEAISGEEIDQLSHVLAELEESKQALDRSLDSLNLEAFLEQEGSAPLKRRTGFNSVE